MRFDWTKLVSWWPTNQGKPKTQAAIIGFILLFVLGAACAKAEPNFVAGGGPTLVRGAAAVANVAIEFPDAGPGTSDYEFGAVFIGGSTSDGKDQPNNFAWYGLLIHDIKSLRVGLGPAYLQNTDNFNGSHLNFALMLGYQPKWAPNWDVRLDLHFSNGGTTDVNKGRDMFLVRYRF
jgi:hypothetical protein